MIFYVFINNNYLQQQQQNATTVPQQVGTQHIASYNRSLSFTLSKCPIICLLSLLWRLHCLCATPACTWGPTSCMAQGLHTTFTDTTSYWRQNFPSDQVYTDGWQVIFVCYSQCSRTKVTIEQSFFTFSLIYHLNCKFIIRHIQN